MFDWGENRKCGEGKDENEKEYEILSYLIRKKKRKENGEVGGFST